MNNYMKHRNRKKTPEEILKINEEYLENLVIEKPLFTALSTPKMRGGNRGKTKSKWRESDGITYPCITYKLEDLEGETTND